MTDPQPKPTRRDRIEDALFHALLRVAGLLPYPRRVALGGWVFSRLVAPLAGYRRRVRDNLALIFPDLPAAEVRRLCRAVPDNIGRSLIEMYSPDAFTDRVTRRPISGPGIDILRAARDAGRPAVLVTGHFGNFNATRAALSAEGMTVAALYRPMNNPLFNAHYVAAMARVGGPSHPRDRRGMAALLRHLRDGGMVGILVDQRMAHGTPLPFLGRDAYTALSAAELALKFDAPLVPIYGIRRPDGLDFDVVAEAPVPRGTAEEMTQALNDSLSARVRDHMDQWFWIHRRWAQPAAHHRAADTAP